MAFLCRVSHLDTEKHSKQLRSNLVLSSLENAKKMLTLSVSPFKNSPKVFSLLLLSMTLTNVVSLIGFYASLSASWLSS